MSKNILVSLAIMILLMASIVGSIGYSFRTQTTPLYVVFIWHYHQPWYYNANQTGFILPWVRMHSIGNYYKMAYILSKHPDVKVTFTFSGSLLVQLVDYVENGLMDYRQELSWKIANGEQLTAQEVYDMVRIPGGFFDINWARIVEQIPRFKYLRDKAQSVFRTCAQLPLSEEEFVKCVADGFSGGNYSSQRIIDLAVLFNLFWIDPMVAQEKYPEIYSLMERAKTESLPKYTLDELRSVLETQLDIMEDIIPTYAELISSGQAEVIPVPYSHPLAPILADFGWREDLAMHIKRSIELFNNVFNYTPVGMWPAEQAINEYVLEVMAENNVSWVASDQSILAKTGVDAYVLDNYGVPWYIDFNGKRIYLFFRHTDLSNLISFVYAKWDSYQAVEDLINRIQSIAGEASGPRFVAIALDGENPWEHYEEFGDIFIDYLYQRLSELQSQGVIQTITPHEFLEQHSDVANELPLNTYTYLDLEGCDIANLPIDNYGDAYEQLPRKTVQAHIPEGSWGAGELTIWIGDRQENTGLMWLAKAREDILDALGVEDLVDAYSVSPEAVEYLLRAEASDWFWWYGGDGGGSPEPFDPLFKAFLYRAYEAANTTPPAYLKASFYPDGTSRGWINSETPKPITETITIDGVLDPAWETSIDAGEGLNISIGPNYIKYMYLAVDGDGLILAFIPWSSSIFSDEGLEISVYTTTPRRSLSPYNPGYNVYPRQSVETDLGLAIAFEILIKPSKGIAYVRAADGSGGYYDLFMSSIGVGDVVEIKIPWSYLGLVAGDLAFIASAIYHNGDLVEYSTRLGKTYRLQVPRAVAAAPGEVIVEINDPVGDDDGAGGFEYPTNPVFKDGVFDIVLFRVTDSDTKIVFETQVRELGGNPWGGPNGFSMQYIHIYIHTTLDVPGRTDTYGLNVNISDYCAWHIAVLIAPGWETDPVPDGQRAAIYYYNDTVIVQDGKFKVYADETTGTIIAEVGKDVLPDSSHAVNWTFTVVLTSYDGYGEYRIRPFGPEAGDWVVGAPGYAQAIVAGVLPRVMDVVAPTADQQYEMLNSFDPMTGKLATLYGVNKSIQEVIPTITVTETATETTTVPTTTTAISIVIHATTEFRTEKTTELLTTTTTETARETLYTTTTVLSTETAEKTVSTTVQAGAPTTQLVGFTLIGLVVGILVALLTPLKKVFK